MCNALHCTRHNKTLKLASKNRIKVWFGWMDGFSIIMKDLYCIVQGRHTTTLKPPSPKLVCFGDLRVLSSDSTNNVKEPNEPLSIDEAHLITTETVA
jgi:hypothetical protein